MPEQNKCPKCKNEWDWKDYDMRNPPIPTQQTIICPDCKMKEES
jgi:hypothetical protein